jgi:hypothetical protein
VDTSSLDRERLYETIATAYADLWAHYHCLIRAIGLSGTINDGRLAVDAQLAMEQEGVELAKEGRRRFQDLMDANKE